MNMSRRGFIAGATGVVAAAASAGAKAVPECRKGALGKCAGALPPGRYDTHIHVYPGEADPDRLVRSFAEAGLAGGCIFSERPVKWEKSWADPLPPAESMDRVIQWASGSPTIYPFYWIDPSRPDACDLVDMAVEKGIYGFKVIRNDGLPVDERTLPVYQKMAKYNKPVTFHTGILWDSYPSSDYFRPANWEGLLYAPKLRFVDQKLYIEKNGKRFNLNGHRIK